MSEISQGQMQRRFAPLETLRAQEVIDENTKSFQGEGTAYLKVPGLNTLEGVTLLTGQGRVPMALSETREYMRDIGEKTPRDEVDEPMFDLQRDGNGDAVLVRSVLSNDGVWQKGVTFLITGQWDAKKSANNQSAAIATPEDNAGAEKNDQPQDNSGEGDIHTDSTTPDESVLPNNPETVKADTLLELPGITPDIQKALRLKFVNRDGVKMADDESIMAIDGIGPKILKQIRDAVNR